MINLFTPSSLPSNIPLICVWVFSVLPEMCQHVHHHFCLHLWSKSCNSQSKLKVFLIFCISSCFTDESRKLHSKNLHNFYPLQKTFPEPSTVNCQSAKVASMFLTRNLFIRTNCSGLSIYQDHFRVHRSATIDKTQSSG